jgi:hypothetical protein
MIVHDVLYLRWLKRHIRAPDTKTTFRVDTLDPCVQG